MHSTALGVSRETRVEQSVNESTSVKDFMTYIPNGNVVEKLNRWKSQGAEIYYLTSRETPDQLDDVMFVLNKYNFPDSQNLLYRKNGEQYKDVAERLIPDIFIEDDCESIGSSEITFPHINPEIQAKIHSIIVKEFAGIDHLPDRLGELEKYNKLYF